MSSSSVVMKQEKDIATVTFNRPGSFNAMNAAFFEDFLEILRDIRHTKALRCAVITGEGRAFSAGGDVGFMSRFENPEKGFQALADQLNSIMLELYSLPVPTIAALNGATVGAGLSVALACDVRIMSDAAFLMFGYTGIGLTPDGGLSWILPRVIGMSRAMKMAVDNLKIDANEALEWGLVHEVVSHDKLLETAVKKALGVSGMAIRSIVTARQLMLAGWNKGLAEQLDAERWAIARAATDEGKEGIRAFVEKREPDFRKV